MEHTLPITHGDFALICLGVLCLWGIGVYALHSFLKNRGFYD